MDRTEKKQFIADLSEELKGASILVVTHYQGLTVDDINELRKRARENGAKVRVTKNTLTRLVVKNSAFSNVESYLKGPTAIIYSADPIAAAKVASKYANDNDKFKVIGGAFGDQTLDANGVKILSSLPSLDELRSRLIGLIQAPASKIVGVTNAVPSQLARVFKAYSEKN
jgi:large subunit ribosomal protein L10